MTALNPGYSLAGTPYKQLPTRPVMPHKDAMLKGGSVLFKPTKKKLSVLGCYPYAERYSLAGLQVVEKLI